MMRIFSLIFGLGVAMFLVGACAQTSTMAELVSSGGSPAACRNSGGSVVTRATCLSASEYANSCIVGAHGCSSAGSYDAETCRCPAGSCWNGSICEDDDSSLVSACTQSGGSIVTRRACLSAGAYAQSCLVGNYGCGETGSHNIRTCKCAADSCWDGKTCKKS
jgi:hypothetical protein